MIYGIGTDIVAVARIAQLLARHGAAAEQKILMPEELAQCRASLEPARYLAKRFAAKEALSKALGTGLRAPVLLSAMGVRNNELGKPEFFFNPELAAYLAERQLRVHLSISDERDTAVAFVVVETA